MSLPDRRENEIRRLLDGGHTPVPADLAGRAAQRGARLLRRRHGAHTALWTVAVLALLVFAAWAVTTQPWQIPRTPTPPISTW